MASPSSSRIAQALAQAKAMGGQPGEPGLESPMGQKILQNLAIAAGGYGMGNLGGSIAQALAQHAGPALQSMGEAGAIFPEGAPKPPDASWKEFGEVLTPTQQNYVRNQNLMDWHAQNMDFPAVLKDKWAMLKHQGGN